MLLKLDNQEVDFFIPEHFKKIAINCSGGADSSILLYMTIKFLTDNNRTDTEVNVLTCSNDFKHRWNGRKAADVINYVLDKTNFSNFNLHYTYYRDVQDVKYFHDIEFSLFKNNSIDLILSGLTSNPHTESIVEDITGRLVNISKTALPERNSKNQKPWSVHENCVWYSPFINVDKKFISYLYNYYEVEDMLDLTRSCESTPEPNSKFSKDFEHIPCGKCWWCLERKWAFGKF